MSMGMPIYADTVKFKNIAFLPPVTLSQKVDENIFPTFDLSVQWGLDRTLIPGISLGLHMGYGFVDITDVTVKVWQENALAFSYSGGFLTATTLSFVPMVELRIFTLAEYIFTTALPSWWELYLSSLELCCHIGPRFNYNIYNESDLKLKGMDDFTIGWEIGIGGEFFVAADWSLRVEYAMYTNETDFKVVENNTRILSGDLDLGGSRLAFWVIHYF